MFSAVRIRTNIKRLDVYLGLVIFLFSFVFLTLKSQRVVSHLIQLVVR